MSTPRNHVKDRKFYGIILGGVLAGVLVLSHLIYQISALIKLENYSTFFLNQWSQKVHHLALLASELEGEFKIPGVATSDSEKIKLNELKVVFLTIKHEKRPTDIDLSGSAAQFQRDFDRFYQEQIKAMEGFFREPFNTFNIYERLISFQQNLRSLIQRNYRQQQIVSLHYRQLFESIIVDVVFWFTLFILLALYMGLNRHKTNKFLEHLNNSLNVVIDGDFSLNDRFEKKGSSSDQPLITEVMRQYDVLLATLIFRDQKYKEQNHELVHISRAMINQNNLLYEFSIYLQRILDSIHTPIFVTDDKGLVHLFNSMAQEFLLRFGVLNEVISEQKNNPWDICGLKEVSNLEALFQKEYFTMSTGENSCITKWEIEKISLLDTKNNYMVLKLISFPVRISSLQEVGRVVVITDLSAEEEMNQKLRISEKFAAVGQMSLQVAHEIRNPLNSIGLNLETLVSTLSVPNNGIENKLIKSIQNEIWRLERLTDNYLNLNRIGSPQLERISLKELISDVVFTHAEWLNEKHIEITVHDQVQNKQNLCWMDPEQIRQVLVNLLKNSKEAIDKTDRSGFITIEVKENELKISDNGAGMDNNTLQKVGTPFFTSKTRGNGLGLAICRQIMESNNGALKIFSTPGQGTTVVLQFNIESKQHDLSC